jgi:SAM-dependent methyltransferase
MMNPRAHETTVTAEMTCGLGELTIRHPIGTVAVTPASLISLRAIGTHQDLLHGHGLDWGSGTGCLAIAAARLPGVRSVVGLEVSEANVAVARENATVNGVDHKVNFLLSDSYSPLSPGDQVILQALAGNVNFIVANPPASEIGDGFEYRRIVLRGASEYLAHDGVVFLSFAACYGQVRVERLCREAPGFAYRGLLASTDWMPFDLNRLDLLHFLRLYADEERRGGLKYIFQHPETDGNEGLDAQTALANYEQTGKSPLSKWQTHRFVFKP